MINTIDSLLTLKNIYLFANWGVIPFWLLLILMPSHNITKFFSHSIIIPLLLTTAYIYITREIILEGNIFESFKLYLGLDELNEMYSKTSSYEALFNKRAQKYKTLGLKEKNLKEKDLKNLILAEYTFLKRPVFLIDDILFVGNSKKVITSLKAYLSNE